MERRPWKAETKKFELSYELGELSWQTCHSDLAPQANIATKMPTKRNLCFFHFAVAPEPGNALEAPPGASDVKVHSHVAKHLNNKNCHKVCLRFWAQPNADQYGMPILLTWNDLSKHISALNVESQFPGDHTIARSFINGAQIMKRPELR